MLYLVWKEWASTNRYVMKSNFSILFIKKFFFFNPFETMRPMRKWKVSEIVCVSNVRMCNDLCKGILELFNFSRILYSLSSKKCSGFWIFPLITAYIRPTRRGGRIQKFSTNFSISPNQQTPLERGKSEGYTLMSEHRWKQNGQMS